MISGALRCALIVSMGGFIFGFDASVISGTLSFVVSEFNLGAWEQGLVVSSPTLGAILSTLTAGMICDAIGRKKVLIAIAFLFLVSAVASALATSFWMLVLARFVGGLAFCSLMIAPMYIAEISQAKTRGKMVSINQLNIMLGFSAAYFANYYILQFGTSNQHWVLNIGLDQHIWRWMLGIEVLPAFIYFALLFTIPESPRWLILNKQRHKAKLILEALRPDTDTELEVKSIETAISGSTPGLLERCKYLFSSSVKLALIIGLVVGISQQITGINAVYFYAPSIFEQSGVGTNAAFIQAIWIGITNIVFTLLAIVLIDKLGRRPLLIIGLSGVFFSMALCAYGFKQANYQLTHSNIIMVENIEIQKKLLPMLEQKYDSDVQFKGALKRLLNEDEYNHNQAVLLQAGTNIEAWLILLGILGFVASFAVSLGPVMWVLFSEIFPNAIRGIAISFVGIINSIVSFSVQFAFPWQLDNLGSAVTFALYSIFALIGLGLVIWIVPETKGKTLEQLEKQLGQDRLSKQLESTL